MSGADPRRRTPPGSPDPNGARILPLCRAQVIELDERSPGAGRRPLVVATDDEGHDAARTELTGAGWTIVDAGVVSGPGRCQEHQVRGRADAQTVIAAAVRGDAVLARIRRGPTADPDLDDVTDDLVEDLAGLGAVLQLDATNAVRLDADTWRLAHEIARGSTLEAAAQLLHLSIRTANRRLTAVRQALGADSRAQLVRALISPTRVPPAIPAR